MNISSFIIDTTAPTLSEVTAVSTPTNDNTSSYTFSSNETGTISYGVCIGSPDNASTGNNTITFNALEDGTYSNCKISVTDNASNTSDNLSVSSFTIDTTEPTSSVTTATITNSGNAVVQSTETGTAYLVKTTVSVSNLTSITGAADSQWNSVAISSASTNTNLAATGLADGTYKVYAVDAAGNLSNASTNSVTLDTTAPTFTFSPANNDTGLADSVNITITFSEPVRLLNDNELTDINIDSLDLITLLYPNVGNTAIDFDATINDNKTIITINPTSSLAKTQDINVAIGATVEDYVGHTITASDATFQTQE